MKEYLSNEKMVKKYQACKKPDEKISIRNTILENNMGLIHRIVSRKLKGQFNQDHDDVVSMAVIKFFSAIDNFKFSKKCSFATYLAFYIDAAIHDFWHNKNVVHIPKSVSLGDGTIGREATNSSLVWLDSPISKTGDGDTTYMDLISSKSAPMADSEFNSSVQTQRLNSIIDKLERHERLIIKYMHLQEIPAPLILMKKMLTIEMTKIRMIEYTALKKIRMTLLGRPANYHIKVSKQLPSDEAIEQIYQDYINKLDSKAA